MLSKTKAPIANVKWKDNTVLTAVFYYLWML